MPRKVTLYMVLWVFLIGVLQPSHAQAIAEPAIDTDRDGLSDRVEAQLLDRFSPTFMISHTDCSIRPAQFLADTKSPIVLADDGTIYGQAFPRSGHPDEVELHYYHLWRRDCGEMGHRLDAEHVSVLVRTGAHPAEAKALYWYAAAHEDTVCDASHLTRARTLHAEDHGATVWLSEGKHASFLSEVMCTRGCGGDRCPKMELLITKQIINLGELGAPMNGIAWLASSEWPLRDKLGRSDFLGARIARVDRLPNTDIAWANPAKRPPQAAILGANAGIGGAAAGARATDSALNVANSDTSSALDATADKTGHALKTSSKDVWKAFVKTAQKTGRVLDRKPE